MLKVELDRTGDVGDTGETGDVEETSEPLMLTMAVKLVIVPLLFNVAKNAISLCLKGATPAPTEISPPLASRTLLVSALLIISPTSCNATIAITPTATQNIARIVRWPPRTSERDVYFKYIEVFTVQPFCLIANNCNQREKYVQGSPETPCTYF